MIHLVNSTKKFSWIITILISLYIYIAMYAILHSGFGPGGQVGDENDVALAINSALPFAFVAFLLARDLFKKAALGLACGLMLMGVVVTNSRGGFLGLVAMLVYSFILAPKKMRMQAIVVGLVVALGIVALSPASYWDEIVSIGQEYENDDPRKGTGALRIEYWTIAYRMFLAYPIFGVGIDNYQFNAGDYMSEDQIAILQRNLSGQVTHSLYFQMLAELGAAGVLVFGLITLFNFADLKLIQRRIALRFSVLGYGSADGMPRVRSLKVSEKVRTQGKVGSSAPSPSEATPMTQNTERIIDDLYRASHYAHALRAGLMGFLISAAFISVFTYPHFWILTALTVALRNIVFSRLNELETYSVGETAELPRNLSSRRSVARIS